MYVCLAGLFGCSTQEFVELRVRDSVTHEPLTSGRAKYEYSVWVPALFPPIYLDKDWGSIPVRGGTARFPVRSMRTVSIVVSGAMGYPQTKVEFETHRNLTSFEPTPWKEGEIEDSADTTQPARLLEFQLAPSDR
jgi:hypothetical protein